MIFTPDYDWRDPWYGDEGLPCAAASLLVSFWEGSAEGVASWAENIAHRIWLPGVWDEHYTGKACETRQGLIASACARALAVVEFGLENSYGKAFDSCMADAAAALGMDGEGGRMVRSARPSHRNRTIVPAGADAERMRGIALMERMAWLGRLHERNKRYDPAYDWADALREMNRLGCDPESPEEFRAAERELAREMAALFA